MQEVEKIQLFLEGKLDAATRQAFEAELKADVELQQKVEDYKKIFSGFRQLKEQNFEEKITVWNKELPPLSEKRKIPFWKNTNVLKFAAAAFVVILAGFAYWYLSPDKSLEYFADKNYISLNLDRERSQEEASAISNAQTFFEKGEYTACLNEIDKMEITNAYYIKAKYLKGHAFYQLEKYEAAAQTLDETLVMAKMGEYKKIKINRDNVKWTSILAQLGLYLKTKDEAEKKELIQQLKGFLAEDPGSSYQRRAKELQVLLK